MRIGIGYDVHRLQSGRKLVLGGVIIPHPTGLLGHSDADVLSHAVGDALLGAAALGDLGQHFPDNDERFKDANSLDLLASISALLKQAGYKVINIDSVIVAQAPRLAPYIPSMRSNIAAALGISTEQVSVKATTTEKLGFEGRQEGISAQAIVLIEENAD
ncbi:MAG: 2-C-methyl-D-erythritol 2,4-cyclodiphosphate synthase [Syntrophomonadaceae bacterium]|nr:2-C-methyl-D-erythritol 2,4-cyclodiphosphate synthase [Bacillota bacterium]NLM87465.1 2-C-methyl-D-erythritol 2,4-cyclodiphosphate synthase [Syntrophomonadaceae bacterium]HQA49482.1 2-C-methyl-D-erythritol 2,4-cyclodiphosphate synthase [Syntrophomonadaceae bacterium]HQD91214.1 2-C-methyl-D-erythritol 2,4-cyclodiphosphate synthase [Syntrophomonadaceae bacterium]